MAAELIIYGIVVHLFVDWLLQNEWMAVNKVSLKHLAAWAHSGLHFIGALLVFPLPFALIIGVTHLLIDTRKPLIWWRRVYRQTADAANPASLHVAIWTDQVAHITVIALVALTDIIFAVDSIPAIFAITSARPRVTLRTSATSSGRCTNDSAIQSTPAATAASRSA